MFEFQMLYGVPMGNSLDNIITKKYRVRIYVPFGEDWYEYSIRRIKENPNISKYVIKNMFRIK
jgi:proline dehydrogenase